MPNQVTQPHIRSFGYVMLVISDRQKSIDFYTRLFQKNPDFAGPNWIQFTIGETIIGLHDPDHWSDPNDPLRAAGSGQKGVSFGFWVDNVNETMTYFQSMNIDIKHGPRTTGLGKTIYVADPDGHIIHVCQKNPS